MEKFLIIKPSSLGDIIHGLQVVQALKDQRPRAHISWVVEEAFAPIVEACACVDQVLLFKRKGGLRAFWYLIQAIRQTHYDFVWDLQGLARSGLLTFFAKASHKLGRGDAREGAWLAYHKKTRNPSHPKKEGGGPRHAIDILLDFLKLMNLKPELSHPLAFRTLPPLAYPLPQAPVLLFPNSRRPQKEWPYFRELTEALIAAYPDRLFVWLGQSPILQPRNASSGQFLNLMGKTHLLEALTWIQASTLSISNDSGPMHMAAALHRPILALFGPTEAASYGPYPRDAGYNHVLVAPGKDLRLLSTQKVFDTARQILDAKQA